MLNRGLNLFIIILVSVLFGCYPNENKKSAEYKDISMATAGGSEYNKIYVLALDSINTWALNNLGYYQYLGKSKRFQLDSLLCFNKKADRFVSCILKQQKLKEGVGDDADFFYGEKIEGKWYFFSGANIFLLRSSFGNDEKTPLSFEKLHEIALKEVYSGYLNEKGEINEEWFKYHFENVGMCSECKTREDFQKNIVAGSAAIWSTRDTTKPIITLDAKKPLP